jgi:parvulin-like peptidyl-prolyl isomerase
MDYRPGAASPPHFTVSIVHQFIGDGLMQTNWGMRCAFLVATIVVVAQPGFPADVEAISRFAVDQRIKFKQLASPGSAPSRDEVFDELLKEWETINRSRKAGIWVSDSVVEQAYAQIAVRMQLTAEQLTRRLARSGIRAHTLKHRIRADIARQRYREWRRPGQPRLWQDPDPLFP